MNRMVIPPIEAASGATADLYNWIRDTGNGDVPATYAALGHLIPASFVSVLSMQSSLAEGSLSHREQEAIKLLISARSGCNACIAAYGHTGRRAGLSADAIFAIRTGQPVGERRLDALLHFVSRLHGGCGTLERSEFDRIRTAGYNDTQLAEISLVIALSTLTNTFNRINASEVDGLSIEQATR